jgi:hypothetical protein
MLPMKVWVPARILLPRPHASHECGSGLPRWTEIRTCILFPGIGWGSFNQIHLIGHFWLERYLNPIEHPFSVLAFFISYSAIIVNPLKFQGAPDFGSRLPRRQGLRIADVEFRRQMIGETGTGETMDFRLMIEDCRLGTGNIREP